MTGEVIGVSPDVNTDQRSGQSYYTIRVSLPPDEVAKLGGVIVARDDPSRMLTTKQLCGCKW